MVYGRYELDYWGNCLLQALGRADVLVPGDVRSFTVSGWPLHLIRTDATRYPRMRIAERATGPHALEVVLARGKAGQR